MTNKKIPIGQRLAALVLAVAGTATMAFSPGLRHALFMCAALLMAWHFAFVPGPKLGKSISEVHGDYQSGKIEPTDHTAKLVVIASILLLLASIIV